MGEAVGELPSIAQRVHALAARNPDEKAFWFVAADGRDTGLTWTELDRRSGQLAGALAERGLGYGDRLGISVRNSPQFILSALAAWKLGAVPVPMRWDLPDWELGRLTQAIDGKVILGEDDLDWIDATADGDVPDLPDVISPHSNGICSSGSTGTPKVILSKRPGVYDPTMAQAFIEHWGVSVPRPQHLIVLGPMYHVNGFSSMFNLLEGDLVVVMEKFDAASAVDVIERHRISTFNSTPTMLQRIADLPDIKQRDLSSIQFLIQGAAFMPPALVHRWADLIGPERIVMAYGSTEQIGLVAIRGDEWMAHQGSVGRGFRDTQIRILDTEKNPLPAGEIGDVYLWSPNYQGATYLGETPQMSSTEDGFHSVSDMGYLDEDGYLYLVDRRVDMIISGGVNIYPAEVETALIDHPKIFDVVVVGLQDDEWGRRVHAIIQPADPADPPTFDEVRAFAKSRLHPFKVPKSIEIIDEIPRSAATKVNRGALVDQRGG